METLAQPTIGTATYSPEDNKLRMRPFARLSEALYERVRSAGFIWAGKQGLFVAPGWSPEREDLLCEFCAEIGDEDTTLVDRAEDRAGRFEDYSAKRADDAEVARAAVDELTGGSVGEPIVVGRHSERQAQKDADKIEAGMKKAVRLWETSKYWTRRAAGALRAAKYKELPDVRARRIKTLEADLRKQQRIVNASIDEAKLWALPSITKDRALRIANAYGSHSFKFPLSVYPRTEHTYEGERSLWSALSDGIITAEQAAELALAALEKTTASRARWVAHFENRLAYEKAMLEDQGASDLIAPKARPKQLPIANYLQASFRIENQYHKGEFLNVDQVVLTAAQMAEIPSEYKGTREVDGSHRVRIAMAHRLPGCSGRLDSGFRVIFLSDSKVHPKPAPAAPSEATDLLPEKPAARYGYAPAQRTAFDDMKDSLRNGVTVVSAPQLYPTPPVLAKRMVELAGGVMSGLRIMDPEAGTGNIVRAASDNASSFDCCRIVAVEISQPLVRGLLAYRERSLTANEANFDIRQADFLECGPELGLFDRILMNPPFADGADIKHILHARKFLKPGGRLVAICAGGPRQEAALQHLADHWEVLPDGSFAEQGTNVRTVLLQIAA